MSLVDYSLLIRSTEFSGQVRSPLSGYLTSCFFFVHDYLTNSDKQQLTNNQQLTLPFMALAFLDPLKSPQNCKCHAITETVCHWRNHALARAWGKLQSAAVDSLRQPHVPHLGIKWKHILIFLWQFKISKCQNCHYNSICFSTVVFNLVISCSIKYVYPLSPIAAPPGPPFSYLFFFFK